MISRVCVSSLNSFFRFPISLTRRHLSTSVSHSLQSQEASISPSLKERLIAQMKENAKQDSKKNLLDCNCLPIKGTPEFDSMMEKVFHNLKRTSKPND